MSRSDISIQTPDGSARAYVFRPNSGAGPWPAVLFFMDGPGIRPALFEMGERLASNGYYVLMPDMYWRFGPSEPTDMRKLAGDPDARAKMMAKVQKVFDPTSLQSDVGAYLAFLAAQPEVTGKKIGTTGYCMGGRVSLTVAGYFPDQVAASGAFHAGNVATDDPNSPHNLASRIRARLFIGGADQDQSYSLEQKARLEAALSAAGVRYQSEIYQDALHGYAPSDSPAYNREASERHWRDMLALFDNELKQAA